MEKHVIPSRARKPPFADALATKTFDFYPLRSFISHHNSLQPPRTLTDSESKTTAAIMANDRDGRRLYKELNAIGLGPGFGGSKTQTAKKNLDELHTKVDVWGKDIDDFVEKQHVHVENEEKLKECGEKLMIEVSSSCPPCQASMKHLLSLNRRTRLPWASTNARRRSRS